MLLLLFIFACSYVCSSLQLKEDYMKLLKETPTIDRFSLWTDVKPDIESDPRYQAVPNDSLREKWFDEYVKALEDVSIDTLIEVYF